MRQLTDRARVEALFDEALEQGAGWRTWLAAACDDPLVRADAARLVEAHEHAHGLLDAPLVVDCTIDELTDAPGDRLTNAGPYRIARELGHGGMGTVYLAERDDGQFARAVAVKVLRRGVDSADVARRFVVERQILASLEHPNVARLIDGGVTDDGRPYIVMEYVDGEPIDAYCDARRLTVAARLALVRDVACAVHAAHRALVVHRDLKPSNVLVTGDGTVKLLDFGIAKLLDSSVVRADVPATRTELRPMTPEYASPEQVCAAPITTATDVYGLGLVLYELLTGVRAHRPRDRSPREIARAVCETEPARPSVVALRDDETARADGEPAAVRQSAEARAAARGATPARLARALSGDLDRIVARALHKEPDRRYRSAEELALDLDRHRGGRPVAARGDSVVYRARKFALRHRWGVAATAALALSLAGYAATVTVQARRVRRALDQALLEAEKAQQVTAFTLGLFESVDGTAASRREVTVHDLLARAAARAERLGAQPAAQAQMLDVVGLVHQRLGDYAAAEPYLRRALALRRRTFGERHEATGESMYHLAALENARGAYVAAESLYRAALAVQRPLLARDHPHVARTLDGLGLLLQDRGDYAGAERLTREALAARRARYGAEHPEVATSLTHLAFQLQLQGRYAEADSLAEQALTMRRRLLGDEHPDVAAALSGLGVLRWQQGQLAVAESLQRRALDMRTRLRGPDHPEVGQTLGLLGAVLRRQGRLAEAESVYRDALALAERTLGPEHPEVAHTLNGLSLTLRDANRVDAADSLQRAVLTMRRRVLGDLHPAVAMSLHQIGVVRAARGEAGDAAALFREALAIRRVALGTSHPLTVESARQLAAVTASRGRASGPR